MNQKKSFSLLFTICLAVMLLTGCATIQKTNYMTDLQAGDALPVNVQEIRLKPGDDIVVFVKTKDEVLTEIFNVATPMAPTQVA